MGFVKWDKRDYDKDIPVRIEDLAPLVDHTPDKPSGRTPRVGLYEGLSPKHTHDHD